MKRINMILIRITIIFTFISWLLIDILDIVLPKGLGVLYWISDIFIWIVFVFCCIVTRTSRKKY